MPEGEVRVRHGADSLGVRRIADVDQHAVAAARASRQTDRWVGRDVVALQRSAPRLTVEHLINDVRQLLAKRRAIGRRRAAGAAARLDEAVQ